MSRTLTVFNPLGRPRARALAGAAPVPDLRGGILAVLDNTKPNARLLMAQVARAAADRVPDLRITFERKSSAADGVTEDTRERLAATANVIFTGSGD